MRSVASRERKPVPAEPRGPVLHRGARTPGKPLDVAMRAYMEPRFQQDFSQVRLHTDSGAAASAKALGARAYTVGNDIVFGSGRPAPDTMAGRTLLAHELAHVVQQRGEPSPAQAYSIGPVHSSAEHEAQTCAEAVSAGRSLPAAIHSQTSGMVQRSVSGDIAGTLAGAGIGAGLGLIAGGPIGALIGGVIGGLAGLAFGDAASAETRGLTSQEQSEAQLVFGKSLNYGAVKIVEAPIMALGGYARTPFGTIYFPPGTSKLAFSDFMPWLIHELTHVWQHQHGVSVFTKLFWALHGAKAYDYGDEPALVKAAAENKHFTDFNTEQQGDILSHYYLKLKAGKDTSAYEPFVAEVKNGTGSKAQAPGDTKSVTARS